MRTPSKRPALLLLLPLLATSLNGCVTERSTATSGFNRPANSENRASSPRPPTDGAATPLPTGPITRPVPTSATRSEQVRSYLIDMGMVKYDGQSLPLVSPDGRFIASQTGGSPTWPTLLAAPGAEVPHTTRLMAYALPDPNAPVDPSKPAAPAVAQPVAWSATIDGVVLGRSADTTGFLIEAPQPGGARWIGRVSWVSGETTWLVKDDAVNAYATLGPADELAFCRRGIDSNVIELVVRPASSDSRELTATAATGGGAYVWPLFSDEPGVVYAVSLTSGNAELHTLRIPERGAPEQLVVIGRHPLMKRADAARVYQMMAALQTPVPSSLAIAGGTAENRQVSNRFDKLLFFHPLQGRMVVFDRRISAITGLFPGSFGAIALGGDETVSDSPQTGYLITTQRGLEYISLSQQSEFDRLRGVPAASDEGLSVLAGRYMPRLTMDQRWPAVLMGPVPGSQEPKIHLYRLRLERAGGG